jgi:hypothetical protein
VGFDGHSLRLRKARLLHLDTVWKNANHGDVVDRRMDEDIGWNAAGRLR